MKKARSFPFFRLIKESRAYMSNFLLPRSKLKLIMQDENFNLSSALGCSQKCCVFGGKRIDERINESADGR